MLDRAAKSCRPTGPGGAGRGGGAARHGRCRWPSGPARPWTWPTCSGSTRSASWSPTGRAAPIWVDRPAGAVLGLVRVLPALRGRGGRPAGPPGPARHVRDRRPAAAGRGADGLRRGLPAADPPDRPGQPQGPQQRAGRPPGGRRLAVGDRRGRGRPRRDPPAARHAGRLPPVHRRGRRRWAWRWRMDLALQCAPDHPWVTEHPEWFTTLADGTIAYAENPPKKYQDIYPLNFDNDPEGIRAEVLRVVLHWVGAGRQDLPGRQPAHQADRLLALADLARSRRSTRTCCSWPRRSPGPADHARARQDRLHPVLHVLHLAHDAPGSCASTARSWSRRPTTCDPTSGRTRPTSCTRRCSTAARPCSRSGRCWPACSPRRGASTPATSCTSTSPGPGAEEYLDNEKYQLRPRDWAAAEEAGESLAPFITRLNEIRRDNPALHWLRNLRFHEVDNDDVLCWSKRDPDTGNTVLVVCSLDPRNAHWANTTLDMPALGLDWHERMRVRDELTGATFVLGPAQRGAPRPVRRAGPHLHRHTATDTRA